MKKEELQKTTDLKKQILDNFRSDIPLDLISFMFLDYKDKIVLQININPNSDYLFSKNNLSWHRANYYNIENYDATFHYSLTD